MSAIELDGPIGYLISRHAGPVFRGLGLPQKVYTDVIIAAHVVIVIAGYSNR